MYSHLVAATEIPFIIINFFSSHLTGDDIYISIINERPPLMNFEAFAGNPPVFRSVAMSFKLACGQVLRPPFGLFARVIIYDGLIG